MMIWWLACVSRFCVLRLVWGDLRVVICRILEGKGVLICEMDLIGMIGFRGRMSFGWCLPRNGTFPRKSVKIFNGVNHKVARRIYVLYTHVPLHWRMYNVCKNVMFFVAIAIKKANGKWYLLEICKEESSSMFTWIEKGQISALYRK